MRLSIRISRCAVEPAAFEVLVCDQDIENPRLVDRTKKSNTWRCLCPLLAQRIAAREAMAAATTMVADYVRAGFSKYALDTSMACAVMWTRSRTRPSPSVPQSCAPQPKRQFPIPSAPPVYVIGTRVPVPGGTGRSSRTCHHADRGSEANHRDPPQQLHRTWSGPSLGTGDRSGGAARCRVRSRRCHRMTEPAKAQELSKAIWASTTLSMKPTRRITRPRPSCGISSIAVSPSSKSDPV